jgi:hypothetical protein
MTDRLHDETVAARREDVAAAPFEFGHRVALAAMAQHAIAQREDRLRRIDRQVAHERLFGQAADERAGFHHSSHRRPKSAAHRHAAQFLRKRCRLPQGRSSRQEGTA